MSMYAREFFTELGLPLAVHAVIGHTYYATPVPGGPLRLKIDFCRTIRVDEYDGLRLATVHQDRGELDVAVLKFTDHHTFDHRDSAQGRRPGQSGYGRFQEFRDRPDWVPWKGAHTNRLRDAIEQYTQVWCPGAWTASAPSRTAGRAPQPSPAVPVTPVGARTR
ncbi:hypothetical protein [Streptomyces sp. GbtcB6]|uniref:hypothetical protein n=1 Tax=Streptomyces sp. GbtcB6 TaxID=2824751 RepID=UPI001C2F1AF8|nr:hypothetical protein [Streptomyces sp. GbtcB6]